MKKIKTILDGKLLMSQTWPNSTLNDCMMPNTVMVSSISRGQEGIRKRFWKILQNSYENTCNVNLFFKESGNSWPATLLKRPHLLIYISWFSWEYGEILLTSISIEHCKLLYMQLGLFLNFQIKVAQFYYWEFIWYALWTIILWKSLQKYWKTETHFYHMRFSLETIPLTLIILEIEGSAWQRYKRALFP